MFLSLRARKYVAPLFFFEFLFQPNVVFYLTSLIHIFYGVWTLASFFVNGFLQVLTGGSRPPVIGFY